MHILLVDDEIKALNYLQDMICEIVDNDKVVAFSSPKSAIKYSCKNKVDVAFIDAHMPNTNGIQLAKLIQKQNPKVNIVIVSSSKDYAFDAININASGYILKPVSTSKIIKELSQLRYVESGCRLRIVCFGYFEIFLDNEPIKFARKKEKELVAYLVNRNGATCTNQQIISEMWEDNKDHSPYFYKLKKDLKSDLEKLGISNLINFNKGSCSINKGIADCDYFDYKDNKSHALDSYSGEYMTQYPWADFVNGSIYSDKYGF